MLSLDVAFLKTCNVRKEDKVFTHASFADALIENNPVSRLVQLKLLIWVFFPIGVGKRVYRWTCGTRQ